jgi:hypothetical protein
MSKSGAPSPTPQVRGEITAIGLSVDAILGMAAALGCPSPRRASRLRSRRLLTALV